MQSIFENMTQSEYDRLCTDENIRNMFDTESDRIGQLRIEEAMKANDWMTSDEFAQYLKDEIYKIFNAQR